MEIFREVDPHLRLVNSEQFAWICVPSGHSKSNLKPDLFSAHHSLIHYLKPYVNSPPNDHPRLFGKFADWNSRESIHCIFDCKWKINMEAFGDKCKYLQITGEECLNINGVEVRLKGILFDVNAFWMINSAGRVIIDVVKCDWLQTGSKEVLMEFLVDKDPWKKAANALCDAMGESIPDLSHLHDISACLGSGANGRVFKLSGKSEVLKLVVGKKKSEEVEEEYLLMLQCQQNILLSSVVFPLVVDSYRCGATDGPFPVEYAGYKLAFEGKKIATPTTNAIKTQLAAALFQLHDNNVAHGDPRIENALLLDGNVRWIDFRLSKALTGKLGREKDVQILFKSLGGEMNPRASGAIDAYARKPTLEGLINIIVGMT